MSNWTQPYVMESSLQCLCKEQDTQDVFIDDCPNLTNIFTIMLLSNGLMGFRVMEFMDPKCYWLKSMTVVLETNRLSMIILSYSCKTS